MQYFLMHEYFMWHCILLRPPPPPTVVIGFEETIYSVNEEDGTAVVYVALLDGSLAGGEVEVTVVTVDGQAVGKPFNVNTQPLYARMVCLYTCICISLSVM